MHKHLAPIGINNLNQVYCNSPCFFC